MIRNKFLFIYIISFTFLLSNTAFADKNLESLLAVLFTQTSAEMKATQLQTFQTATNLLDDALKDSSWTAIPNSSPKDKPPAIILDEPTAGVDTELRRSLWDFLIEINKKGTTIILTTHNMEEAENLCHKVAIMDKGKIIIEGNPKDLIQKYDREDGNLENVFLSLTGKELRD